MSFSSGQTKLSVTGCRYQVSVRRAGFHSRCNFESTSPAKTGVLVAPVFLGFKFSDGYRLGC